MPRKKATSLFANRAYLETLIAVAEAGSISRAARRLGVRQPAISRSVGICERIAGAPLFERRHGGGQRGVRPSLLGFYAIERARYILHEMDDADAAFARVRAQLAPPGGWE